MKETMIYENPMKVGLGRDPHRVCKARVSLK